jgi:hypothetical protein
MSIETDRDMSKTYLENDVLGKDMFDARDDILHLTLCELNRFIATLEYGSICLKFRYFRQLSGID